METKLCWRCKKDKDVEEFSVKNKATGLRQPSCKKCQSEYSKEWYQRNKDTHKANTKKTNYLFRAESIQFVHNYFAKNPCVDCGESDPIVLEFDHIRDKDFNISSKVGVFSHEKLLAEMEKCEVRCANCHRRKTAKQFNWYAKIK